MRKSRFEPSPAYHKPVGISNTIKGAHMTVQELLKSTTLLERQKMIENSPLIDMYPEGIDAEAILDQVDLSQQPIDLTDAEALYEYAQKQVRDRYEAELKARAEQKKCLEMNVKKRSKPVEKSDKVIKPNIE